MLDRAALLLPKLVDGQEVRDIICDLRIGLAAGDLHNLLGQTMVPVAKDQKRILSQVAEHFRRLERGKFAAPKLTIANEIDRSITAWQRSNSARKGEAVSLLVNLELNLFPSADFYD